PALIRREVTMSEPADLASAIAETAVLRTVIEQLLCVRDLDQLLLSISDRTLHLLDAIGVQRAGRAPDGHPGRRGHHRHRQRRALRAAGADGGRAAPDPGRTPDPGGDVAP